MTLLKDWHYNDDDYENNKFGLIPEGLYRVRIEDVQEKVSSNGNNMIELTLAVSGYASKVWYYLVLDDKTPDSIKKTNWRLGSIFDSFDIVRGNTYLSDWRGCVGGAKIKHSEDINGKKKAEIQYFLTRDKVYSLPDWQEHYSQNNINPDMVDFDDTASGSASIPF